MKTVLFCSTLLICALSPATAQNSTSLPSGLPPLTAKPQEPLVSKKDSENMNALLTEARKASAEKRFADSEALMLKVTQANPKVVLPWVELGLAQLGLKKYAEAENDFKTALGMDSALPQQEHAGGFYQAAAGPGVVAPTATRNTPAVSSGGVVSGGEKRSAEVKGASYAGLGEIYAHEGKLKEAKEAFDSAVVAFPPQAAQYRHNEMIVFFQNGQSDEQLAAAEQAIALDPTRASNFYFKAQALVMKATLDPKTQKMTLPPGCAEAYQKYLQLEPNGPYSADAKGILEGAGIPLQGGKR